MISEKANIIKYDLTILLLERRDRLDANGDADVPLEFKNIGVS